jgi:nucleotide-binding universal stress UspA family protein
MIGNRESEVALEVACSLAVEHVASVTALTVIEVPPALPLDVFLTQEEANARRLLSRAEATGDAHGVAVTLRRVRARDAAATILEAIDASAADLVVIGAPRRNGHRLGSAFGRTVQHVLRKAACPVLLVAAPPAPG